MKFLILFFWDNLLPVAVEAQNRQNVYKIEEKNSPISCVNKYGYQECIFFCEFIHFR